MSKNCNNDDVGSDCQWWVNGLCEHVETCGEPRKIEPLKTGEHTPGPWKVDKETIIQDSEGRTIAQTWPNTRLSSDQSLAAMHSNARLISAAPCLLEACLLAVEPLSEGEDCGLSTSTYNFVCKAIAKATQ